MPGNGHLHVQTSGPHGATPIVLLHGFLGCATDWDDLVRDLAVDHQCVRVDLPGHGQSLNLPDAAYTFSGAVDAIATALAPLSLPPAALVGYSMGGRLALALAARAPARWRALVLESASAGLESDAARAERVAADEEWAARLDARPLDDVLREWYRQPVFAFGPAGAPKPLLARRRANRPPELARALRGLGTGRQPSFWPALAGLPMPLLLLAGARDAKYAELSERMRRLCPRAERVMVSDAGHNVHADAPGAWLREVRRFLATCAQAG